MDEYIDRLKGKVNGQILFGSFSHLLAEEVLMVRYYPEAEWFVVSGRFWDSLFTRDEFVILAKAIAADYAPDEPIRLANEHGNESATRKPMPKKRKPKAGYIYILSGGGYYKIGMTEKIDRRLAQISPALPFEIELVHTIKTDDMVEIERFLHEKFADKQTNGEWFCLSDDDIEWLKEIDYVSCEGGEVEA